MNILRYLPKKWMSFFIGKLAHIPLPQAIASPLIMWFVKRYKVNLDEVKQPFSSFSSLGQFFVRTLKEGVRPVGIEPVSPADSFLRNTGQILPGSLLPQVKDETYTISRLLGSPEDAIFFKEGVYGNFYLSPKDYHHVHSPVTGTLKKITYIPGALWPVNDWSMYAIKELFCVNERIVCYITTEAGEVAVVLVGATNVGRISLSFDATKSNTAPWKKKEIFHKEFESGIPIKAGELLGTFHLGSTVVVLFDSAYKARYLSEWNSNPRSIRFGETLLR